MELYEITSELIDAGVYDVSNFNINLNYPFNDSYNSPYFIGGERYVTLRYDATNNELYAKKEGSEEETLLRGSDGEWVQPYYSKFYYHNGKEVSAVWASVLKNTSFATKYTQAKEDLIIRTNNGNSLLTQCYIGSSQNGIPANVELIIPVNFSQTGSEVSISYSVHDWWEKTITKTYRNDFQVIGYSETEGGKDIVYQMNNSYSIRRTLT